MTLRMDQLARNMACAGFHTVEQRLARWLLMVKDRAHSNELLLTQEVLSHMLGVRRESVTQAASALQKKELISYSRGDLMLLKQPELEEAACSCYEADLAIYERAMDSLALVQKPGVISKSFDNKVRCPFIKHSQGLLTTLKLKLLHKLSQSISLTSNTGTICTTLIIHGPA